MGSPVSLVIVFLSLLLVQVSCANLHTRTDASQEDARPLLLHASQPSPALLWDGRHAAAGAPTELFSSFRKDYFLSYKEYPEYNQPDPTQGGRVHVVGVAQQAGDLHSLLINGEVVDVSPGANFTYDWMHLWPLEVQAGDPVWISFHSRDPLYDSATTVAVRVLSSNGQTVLEGDVGIQLSRLLVTYVATQQQGSSLVVHLFNGDAVSHTVASLLVNGRNVTGASGISISAQGTYIFEVPMTPAASIGQVWTVVVTFEGAGVPPIGYGGRILKEIFPIEVWQKSDQCPFPTVNDKNYQFHVDHGVDTFFLSPGYVSKCNTSVTEEQVINELAPKYKFWVMPTSDLAQSRAQLQDSSQVAAIFLADENDGELDHNLRDTLATCNQKWSTFPELATYQGGKTNRHDGAYAGITDIQGMDMYVAACAPHIQTFLHWPPLWGSFDYLRNTRNNHMPLTTWTYSQGIFDGWNGKIPILDKIVYRNPDPAELRIQMMSVMAAGSKGMMLFQSDITQMEHGYADSFAEWAKVAEDYHGVRELLRVGDLQDGNGTLVKDDGPDQSFATVIRSPQALLIPIVLTKNDGGYDDEGCALQENMHWKINPHTIANIRVRIPETMSVVDIFEVRNGQILALPYTPDVDPSSRTVTFKETSMDASQASRLFVIASSPQVRQDIQYGFEH